MKKITRKVLLSAMLVTLPLAGHAGSHVWSDWYPVKYVYTYSEGTVFIGLDPASAHPNPAGCASSSWLRVLPSQVNVKEMYQMALTAQAAGLKIRAYIAGTECAGNYPKIYHLMTTP